MCNVFVACILAPNIMTPCLGGGFNFFGGKMNPFWRAYFFQMGWFNHQPVMTPCCCVRFVCFKKPQRKIHRKTQPFLDSAGFNLGSPWKPGSHQPWVSGRKKRSCSWQKSWGSFIWVFPKNKGTPKWMVYNGKPYWNWWFGGTTIFGNIHIYP